jgi:sn-glycerol 3-phosphate transport system ATP-binding protein
VGPITVDVASPPLADAILAFRPEHVRLSADATPLAATITLVEPLGAETIVHARLANGTDLTVRLGGADTMAVGSQVHLAIDVAHALVYDGSGRLAGKGRA